MEQSITYRKELTDADIVLINNLSLYRRPGHPHTWLEKRKENIDTITTLHEPIYNEYINEIKQIKDPPLKGRWGFKEPNSHMIMKRLHKKFRNMKFIMVVRNGLDMAFSTNQNQLKLWGPEILDKKIRVSPKLSLKYWHLIHKKILEEGEDMDNHFLMINFDDMCVDPKKWLTIFCHFLGINDKLIPNLIPFISPPGDSIGRFKQHGLDMFYKEDVEYVRELGFDTSIDKN